jgi:aspartyl-tRNA(Asn)/glutamyl-tRNA(Gln) amidotransferase subunit A
VAVRQPALSYQNAHALTASQRRASTQAPRRVAPAPPAASSRSVIRRLAHEMSTRQRSAVEITDAYLAAIAAAQPSLRAFLATTPEVARAAAAAVDARRAAGETLGPLAGIPLAIKVRL